MLSISVWIGGKVFAHIFFLPAVAQLEAPLRLMHDVLGRYFRAVAMSEWAAVGAALAQIRTLVLISLGLGVLVLLVTLMGWTTQLRTPQTHFPAS